MSNPTSYSPLFVESKPNGTLLDALVAVDNEAAVKCCRICLEDEDESSMIAPCVCKGSMKWVHRSCLDEWRRNERDRAFSQCTECHFHYHFIEKESAPESFWNRPRTKFCLFISRDIIVVTLFLQCLIGLFGLLVMFLDRNQNWNLTHIFDTSDSPYRACRTDSSYSSSSYYESTSGSTTSVLDVTLSYCNHHALAMYYLFGIVTLLATVGLLGTSIFCCNGCRIPESGDSRDTQVWGNESLKDAEAPKVSMEREDAQSQDTSNQNQISERRAQYYRERRRRRQNRADDCCSCCCSSSRTSPNYYYNTPNECCFVYDGASTGSDCCCRCCDSAENTSDGDGCCCNGPHHNVSSNDCSCDGDATAILFFVVLLFFIVTAVIGLFMVFFIGVVVCQRIVQRHMFRLQKKQLVQEFQVADLSDCTPMNELDGYGTTRPLHAPPSSSTLNPIDLSRLKKLGLIVDS